MGSQAKCWRGCSGAGKTVSAKYIMRYFATADDQESVGKSKKSGSGMTEVEEQILGMHGGCKKDVCGIHRQYSHQPHYGSLW